MTAKTNINMNTKEEKQVATNSKSTAQESTNVTNSFSQIEVDLTKPLDKDAPPTICSSPLKPELATAAFTLAGDFLRQDESLANKYVFWHPLCGFVVLVVMGVYWQRTFVSPSASVVQDLMRWTDIASVLQFATRAYHLNRKEFLSSLIVFCIALTVTVQFFTRFVKMYFIDSIVAIENTKGEDVFQVNLEKLANLDKTTVADQTSLNNCNLVLYRNSPIAMVAIDTTALNGEQGSGKPVVEIKSIGCRKVYLSSGILEDLLEWSKLRTRDLLKSSGSKADSATLIVRVHSSNIPLKKSLKNCKFLLTENKRIGNQFILSGLLGLKRQKWTYEVAL